MRADNGSCVGQSSGEGLLRHPPRQAWDSPGTTILWNTPWDPHRRAGHMLKKPLQSYRLFCGAPLGHPTCTLLGQETPHGTMTLPPGTSQCLPWEEVVEG